tara:strand:- start:10917 stop:13133 length:2217 start_codon:yes stop_codon:yes gene_type:complete
MSYLAKIRKVIYGTQHHYFFSVIATSLSIGWVVPAMGADKQDSTNERYIEEVVVTAQKREQSVQDVAASLTAVSADELEAKGIKDLTDLQFAVPGMHFGGSLGDQDISIRGIGAYNRQPGVAVSIDGVYQARTTTAQLYQLDLARIEVLRGPQGTLYGKNSNGGAVNFVTADPTREAEGKLGFGYSDYNEYALEAFYSGPISDRVSFRVALDHTDRGDGWIKNNVPGQEDLMQGRMTNLRLKLQADMTDNLSVGLMYAKGALDGPLEQYVLYTDNRALATGVPQILTANVTTKPLETFSDTETDTDREYDLFSVTVNWDGEWASLKSITAYQEFDDSFVTDRDASDLPIFDVDDDTKSETFSQEFNLVGGSDTINWVAGVYYMKDEGGRRNIFNNALPVQGLPLPSTFDFNQTKYETTSVATFFDLTWGFSDRARVSVGLRHTKDEISEAHNIDFSVLTPTPVLALQICDQAIDEEWDATTVRVVGQYDLSESSNLYLSYSEGYKAGGVAQYECTPAYNPEEVNAYELGYKGTLGDGRTSLNAAFFAYDYQDFQISQVQGIGSVTRNAGDAEVKGAEFELSTVFNENWSASMGVTFLKATYGTFSNVDAFALALGNQDATGNPLSKSPKRSVNAGVVYNTAAPWGGNLNLRLDAAYRSRTYFREFEVKDDSQPAYTVVNINAGWQSENGDWEARLFAKNATDEEYITNILAAASVGGRYATWGAPRIIGFQLTRRFGG